jgi:hypothetical protein
MRRALLLLRSAPRAQRHAAEAGCDHQDDEENHGRGGTLGQHLHGGSMAFAMNAPAPSRLEPAEMTTCREARTQLLGSTGDSKNASSPGKTGLVEARKTQHGRRHGRHHARRLARLL